MSGGYYSLQNLLSSKNKKFKRNIILPVVLYGCDTRSLRLREERRLRTFEKRVLRRIFGPQGGEVTGKWRTVHSEDLNDVYSSPNDFQVIKSRRMSWAGHVVRIGDEGCIQDFGGETWGKETTWQTQA